MSDIDTVRVTHPDYSGCTFPSGGGDRCVCGGVRHWHACPPYGCDDCKECASFVVAPLGPTEAQVREQAAQEIEAFLASPDGPGPESHAAHAYRDAARIVRGTA